MQINISDETYRAIAEQYGDVTAFLEKAAQQALGNDGGAKPKFNAETLLADFQALEGMFGNASLLDVLDDRRIGRK